MLHTIQKSEFKWHKRFSHNVRGTSKKEKNQLKLKTKNVTTLTDARGSSTSIIIVRVFDADRSVCGFFFSSFFKLKTGEWARFHYLVLFFKRQRQQTQKSSKRSILKRKKKCTRLCTECIKHNKNRFFFSFSLVRFTLN